VIRLCNTSNLPDLWCEEVSLKEHPRILFNIQELVLHQAYQSILSK